MNARRLRLLRLGAALPIFATMAGCNRVPETDPRMVSEWMHTLYGVVRAERLGPPVASRFLAYAAVTLHEGMAAATPGLPTLAGVLNGLGEMPSGEPGMTYDATLVAVAAERVLIDSLLVEALPTTQATLAGIVDSLRNGRMELGVGEAVAAASAELGRRIGLATVAWSRSDGFAGTRGRTWVPPVGPDLWINDTPAHLYAAQNRSGSTEFVAPDNPSNTLSPGSASDRDLIMNRPKRAGVSTLPALNMAGVTEPYWGEVRPFILKTWGECALPDPPPFSTEPDSPFYREAMAVRDAGRDLTPEQRTIALYWADNPGETGTPTGHWVSIASQMVSVRNLSAGEASRLFVGTAAAQADAFIAAWGYKFRRNLIRPRTYLRRVVDPAWEPLIPTPPFPEYPSAHSTQSAAAATVLTMLVGEVAFEDSTGLAIGHTVRRFGSFREAADEAGQSRIFGGIHYPFGNVGGQTLGRCIGERVTERLRAAVTP